LIDMIGESIETQKICQIIKDIADSNANVLISGENGTGKGLIARSIHQQSSRRDKPFVVAHCASYCQTLMASELFGHEKGAFTGAGYRKVGRFEKADEGTVFLDEIGSISQETQVMLLRVLEDRCFERVGGENTITTNARVLSATNKNLATELAASRFREDLYYRLNVIGVYVPPLRERKEDIPLLVEHFMKTCNRINGKNIKRISTAAMDLLMRYNWPGNIRELRNKIERGFILTKGDTIREDVLLPDMRDDRFPKGCTLVDQESRLIWSTLQECHWNKHEAARRLGIHRATLYSKIKRFALSPQRGFHDSCTALH